MHPFSYVAVTSEGQALAAGAGEEAMYLAGGTNLIDEMKLNVRTPSELVDVTALPLGKIEGTSGGGVMIGAMVRNSDLAWDKRVKEKFPVLSEALLSGASPQLRNMATTGGNLLQKTRCYYYRDVSYPCNKREPGSGCSAIEGYNRIHAVLGVSDKCIATHPSDMCVALVALDAVIHVEGKGGKRKIPINDFYVAYGEDPAKENVLEHGELITAVEIPGSEVGKRSHYLKVRDRASYEFALASAAVGLSLDGGMIRDARVALGGVGSKPWRSKAAEDVLVGKRAEESVFAMAAEVAMKDAKPQKHNGFKVELARRTIVQALLEVTR